MDLWRLIMANHRTPRNTWGDLNAQIGSLRVAERSVTELLDRYGRDVRRRRPPSELMDYSERWMRAEIAAHPGRRLRVHRDTWRTTASVDDAGHLPRHGDRATATG